MLRLFRRRRLGEGPGDERHPQGVVAVRVNQPPQFLEEARGPPLGVIDDFPYEPGQIKLDSNDILLLMTDGITEATDQQYEQVRASPPKSWQAQAQRY